MTSPSSGQHELLEKLEQAEQRGLPAQEDECVVLFVDIVGYSKYASTHTDEEALEMVRRFEQAARGLIDRSGGRVVMTAGDAIMACWQSSSALSKAVNQALAMMDKLKLDNAQHKRAERIRVRVGIHCGRVMRLQDGDLIGHAVNLAARIQTAAMPDEILLSEAAAECGADSPDMPPLRRVGRFQLKNIDEPQTLYCVETRRGGHLKRALRAGFARAFNPRQWPLTAWAILIVGALFSAGCFVKDENGEAAFRSPAGAAAVVAAAFLGWAMIWAGYRWRTISLWHRLGKLALAAAWFVVAAAAGALAGLW